MVLLHFTELSIWLKWLNSRRWRLQTVVFIRCSYYMVQWNPANSLKAQGALHATSTQSTNGNGVEMENVRPTVSLTSCPLHVAAASLLVQNDKPPVWCAANHKTITQDVTRTSWQWLHACLCTQQTPVKRVRHSVTRNNNQAELQSCAGFKDHKPCPWQRTGHCP